VVLGPKLKASHRARQTTDPPPTDHPTSIMDNSDIPASKRQRFENNALAPEVRWEDVASEAIRGLGIDVQEVRDLPSVRTCVMAASTAVVSQSQIGVPVPPETLPALQADKKGYSWNGHLLPRANRLAAILHAFDNGRRRVLNSGSDFLFLQNSIIIDDAIYYGTNHIKMDWASTNAAREFIGSCLGRACPTLRDVMATGVALKGINQLTGKAK
jgi:hypothetical protein